MTKEGALAAQRDSDIVGTPGTKQHRFGDGEVAQSEDSGLKIRRESPLTELRYDAFALYSRKRKGQAGNLCSPDLSTAPLFPTS